MAPDTNAGVQIVHTVVRGLPVLEHIHLRSPRCGLLQLLEYMRTTECPRLTVQTPTSRALLGPPCHFRRQIGRVPLSIVRSRAFRYPALFFGRGETKKCVVVCWIGLQSTDMFSGRWVWASSAMCCIGLGTLWLAKGLAPGQAIQPQHVGHRLLLSFKLLVRFTDSLSDQPA